MKFISTGFSSTLANLKGRIRDLFVQKTDFSQKTEIKLASFKWMGLTFVIVFVGVVLMMPNEIPTQFSEKIERDVTQTESVDAMNERRPARKTRELWASPSRPSSDGSESFEVNQNTSMVIGNGQGDARTQLRFGTRLPIRILDKVIVSQDSVPVLAELLLDGMSESGLRLPAGTKFYGEASFTKGTDRANIEFKQISLPNGQIKNLTAKALSKDGQPGVAGRVHSDGAKNTGGQVLTTFVGGLAAGSMETDIFGRSKGGLENGLLSAVAETARGKAQSYGENLKAEREWIEIRSGSECDALLTESINLQQGTKNE